MQDVLNPLGLNDTEIGFIGFNLSTMTTIGETLIRPIADHCFDKQLMRLLILIYIIIIVILLILFIVSLIRVQQFIKWYH